MPDFNKKIAQMIIIGASLMFSSVLLSLLMTIRIIEPSFVLVFASSSLSIVGLVMGFYGLYELLLTRRTKGSKEEIRSYE